MLLEVLCLLALGVIAAVVGRVGPFDRPVRTERERPVLPSHYSSLLYTNPSYYPGHCTSCGTDNEPGYRFCEACGDPIPTSRSVSSRPDVGQIFDD